MKNQLLVIAISTVLISSCAPKVSDSQSKPEVKSETTVNELNIAKDITVEEYKNMISADAIILDVRTPGEFTQGHLENAININFRDENFVTQVQALDKSKALLIHCASGGRSARAMSALKDKGFTKLYNMLGGYNAWISAGNSVVQ